MKRWICPLLIVMGGLFFGGVPLMAQELPNPSIITCEDGIEFVIQEKGAIQTGHFGNLKGDYIIVNIKQRRLVFYHQGQPIRSYPVAIGETKTPTPIGEWKVIHKGGKWGNGFGDRWIGLNVPWGIYGIHGTNKPWLIGSYASHGCIRLFNSHVLELYNLVKLGTSVHIIGDLPKVVPRKEVARNNTGRDIIAFQFALRKAGFDPGTVDGRFGAEMEQAVLGMQFFYGLAPTGKLSLNEQMILGFR
ncbi:MAG TPA: hypothetical protein DDW65_05965 [Firmicutes bacterium]|jgi:hypothetical protein|nr:hypothetical protein [Bacillota bacterium]